MKIPQQILGITCPWRFFIFPIETREQIVSVGYILPLADEYGEIKDTWIKI